MSTKFEPSPTELQRIDRGEPDYLDEQFKICPACGGEGEISGVTCLTCHGAGDVPKGGDDNG